MMLFKFIRLGRNAMWFLTSTTKSMSDIIDKLHEKISSNTDAKIILLRNINVIKWLYGYTSFLSDIEKKATPKIQYKPLEDKWGQTIMKMRRPDLH